jgi:hypothetical protein
MIRNATNYAFITNVVYTNRFSPNSIFTKGTDHCAPVSVDTPSRDNVL